MDQTVTDRLIRTAKLRGSFQEKNSLSISFIARPREIIPRQIFCFPLPSRFLRSLMTRSNAEERVTKGLFWETAVKAQNVWGRINYERNFVREKQARTKLARNIYICGYITATIDVSEAVINGSARREIIPRTWTRPRTRAFACIWSLV